MNKQLILTAMGKETPDLILKNGNIVNVFSGNIITGDIIIKDGIICGVGSYSGENEIDITGKYVMPGFIDAHVHIESSMAMPGEYAKAVMAHGVTTVIADPHEITNVCGEAGLDFMLDASHSIPLDINLMLPSCVPATPFEHTGAVLTAQDTKRLIPKFFGIGEMMNYPGVIAGDDEVLAKLCSGKIDGHAPLLSGHELDAYLCGNIKSDHECGSTDEMAEKINKGMYVFLREGTLSHDISRLTGGINSYTLRRCAFCTDDRFIGEIIREGSIDHCIRKAVSLGIKPIDAIIMATLNACELYGIKNKGAVAPSYIADMVIADDLSFSSIDSVYKNGKLVCKDGKALFDAAVTDTKHVTNTVHLDSVTADFFADAPVFPLCAIEMVPDSIATKKIFVNSTENLSKVCVIERHKHLGTKGIGYVSGYGIKNGAIAMSIGHDSHNIIVIGDNDSDMALAVNTLGKSGGIAVCSKGSVLTYMQLDIAGLMSSKSFDDIILEHDRLYQCTKQLCVTDKVDPILSLAFLPLPVIPEIRITDSGLFDVTSFSFI